MKYMSFNSSCAYAGLANMLAHLGVNAEDWQIALDMGLPYLFAREEGQYRAGPMLQDARWFDLYLRPRGFAFLEAAVPRDSLPAYLPGRAPAMLGLRIGEGKHAVVFVGVAGDSFRFLNNRHPSANEPDEWTLTAAELLARVDPQVHVATLTRIAPEPAPLKPRLMQSLHALADYRREMAALEQQPFDRPRLRELMDTHLRAFLLDALTMMRLAHEDALAQQLTSLQAALLNAVRTGAEGTLAQLLPMEAFMRALSDYEALIARKDLSM